MEISCERNAIGGIGSSEGTLRGAVFEDLPKDVEMEWNWDLMEGMIDRARKGSIGP